MIRPLQDITMKIFIVCCIPHPFQIAAVAVPSFDQERGRLYILQPMDGRTHNIFLFFSRIKGKLTVIMIFDVIHCAKTEYGTELIRILGRQQCAGASRTVSAQINTVGIHIGQ